MYMHSICCSSQGPLLAEVQGMSMYYTLLILQPCMHILDSEEPLQTLKFKMPSRARKA